jgi:hypothetical protein
MTRISVQLAVGLALGILTTATAAGFDGVDFQTATVAATAASTIIAPRFWWTGLTAFWIGQSVGWSISNINEFDVFGALLFPYFASARAMLVGAVIGGAMWYVVDLRRKRIAAAQHQVL